jgi:hypothetical protein
MQVCKEASMTNRYFSLVKTNLTNHTPVVCPVDAWVACSKVLSVSLTTSPSYTKRGFKFIFRVERFQLVRHVGGDVCVGVLACAVCGNRMGKRLHHEQQESETPRAVLPSRDGPKHSMVIHVCTFCTYAQSVPTRQPRKMLYRTRRSLSRGGEWVGFKF